MIKFIGLLDLIKMLINPPQKDLEMSKEQIVADAISAIQAGQLQVMSDQLGQVYDKAQSEAQPSQPGPSDEEIQKRIDDAVAAKQVEDDQKLAEQKALDDQALADAKSAADAAMADLQKKFDDLAGKEMGEKSLIDGLQGSIDALKDVLAKLQAIFPQP
jgi:hypothetical protein